MKNGSKWLALLMCVSLVMGFSCGALADEAPIKVGILQYVEHAALDEAARGFIDALKAQGLVDGENAIITLQNASGDSATLSLMANQLVLDGNSLLLGIATPAVQVLSGETGDIPILGTAVTDYVGAGLIAANDAPGVNVSGTTDMNPIDLQIALIKEMFPDAQTLGICYTSNEPNSQIQADIAKIEAEKLGMTVLVKTISAVGEVQQAVESMVGQVDALYIPTDNIFASAATVVGDIAVEAKLPVVTGEENMCREGGLATVGLNYYNLGYQTGLMAARVLLESANPAEMPIESLSEANLCLNLTTAELIGFEFSQKLMDEATVFFPEPAAE